MKKPALFRRRFIPDELIELKDDVVCFSDGNILVTRWDTLKPRPDIAGGISLYLPDKCWKISRVFDKNGALVYHYCDIILTDYSAEENKYTFTDLLIDIIIYPDGKYSVVDMDEMADALDSSLIDASLACTALRAANALIKKIEDGEFGEYVKMLEKYV